MLWKVKYWGRLGIEKALDTLRLNGLHEWVKKASGRKSGVSESFVIERVERKLALLENLMAAHPIHVVHEQGTGWHGLDLIIFYLLGLRVYTTDVRRLLNYSLLKAVVQTLSKNVGRFPDYSDRIQQLVSWQSLPFEEFLERAAITYYVDKDFLFPEVQDVDLFYSDSVLQRMKPNDLRSYAERSKSVGSEICFHEHRIDCNDFFSIQRKHIMPALYYLTIPDVIWETITAKRLNYQNRLRMPEFVQVFEQAGWSTRTDMEVTRDEYIEYVVENRQKIKAMNRYPAEEVAIAHFLLRARIDATKPNSA